MLWLPPDTTHLIVSAGGNDALGHIDFLGAPVGSAAEALLGLADIAAGLERRYQDMIVAGAIAELLERGFDGDRRRAFS